MTSPPFFFAELANMSDFVLHADMSVDSRTGESQSLAHVVDFQALVRVELLRQHNFGFAGTRWRTSCIAATYTRRIESRRFDSPGCSVFAPDSLSIKMCGLGMPRRVTAASLCPRVRPRPYRLPCDVEPT